MPWRNFEAQKANLNREGGKCKNTEAWSFLNTPCLCVSVVQKYLFPGERVFHNRLLFRVKLSHFCAS